MGFISFLGGLFLIIGAFFIMRGNIYLSVAAYFFADIAWVLMAIVSGHWISATVIIFGMACGSYTWFKMHKGQYKKSIKG